MGLCQQVHYCTLSKHLEQYQSLLEKFEQKLKKSIHIYELCQNYIKRGTTDLDREYVEHLEIENPGPSRKLYEEELQDLKTKIQKCYRYYHFMLNYFLQGHNAK